MKNKENKRRPIIVEKDNNNKNIVKGYSGNCFYLCDGSCINLCIPALCTMNCNPADPYDAQNIYIDVYQANFSDQLHGAYWL